MEVEQNKEIVESAVPQIRNKEHHETIHDILMDQDEITWQTIIMELIKTEQMDPWNIDVSQLSQMFIKTLKQLKELNLRLSGKVLLAAALLLRIKSSKLVGEDLMEFDRLLASGENEDLYSTDEDFVEDELGNKGYAFQQPDDWKLVPKTPQPRKRKVSVYDLIDALAIALNTRRRRIINRIETPETRPLIPEKKVDISQLMDEIHNDVMNYLNTDGVEKMAFSSLLPQEGSKRDKVLTFIPLLHLTNARKTDLEQHEHFGEIWIKKVTDETKRLVEEQLKREAEQEAKRDLAEKKKKEANKLKRLETIKRREEREKIKAEKETEKISDNHIDNIEPLNTEENPIMTNDNK